MTTFMIIAGLFLTFFGVSEKIASKRIKKHGEEVKRKHDIGI